MQSQVSPWLSVIFDRFAVLKTGCHVWERKQKLSLDTEQFPAGEDLLMWGLDATAET